MIDEADMLLHPEWQRKFINTLVSFFKPFSENFTIQLLIATHSPIMLSDIPKQNVLFLNNLDDGIKECDGCDTFASNIFQLFREGFFIGDTGIGVYAEKKLKEIVDHIIQVVKLIRSKGIGLYFISQTPSDIPDEILGQLGNRVQHVLRSYTKSDEKIVKAAADSYRDNPEFDTFETIKTLKTGEALVSFQQEDGSPSMVEKVTILPPQSLMGTITDDERKNVIVNSNLYMKYEEKVNERSAYEINEEENRVIEEKKKMEEEAKLIKEKEKEEERLRKEEEKKQKELEREEQKRQRELEKEERERERARKNNPAYKIGKKVVNKTADKMINKGLNAILKGLFK